MENFDKLDTGNNSIAKAILKKEKEPPIYIFV